MNYHLYLSTKKTNSEKLAPVYAKINFNGKRLERSTGVFVCPKTWNNLYKRIVPTAFGAAEANEKINQFENKLKQLMAMESLNITIINKVLSNNANIETNIYTLKSTITAFLKHKEALIDKTEGITLETHKSYKAKEKNVIEFLASLKMELLEVQEFNYITGEKFKSFLYSKNFSASHVNKHLKFMRSIIKFAQFEYQLPPSNLMLLKIKEPALKPIVYLTDAELENLQKHVFLCSLHQKAADIFLLQCFTGMAYCDVIKLNNTYIVTFDGNDFISYNRQKTGVNGLIPFLPQVKAILNRYNGKAPVLVNQLYNRTLKEIAAACNITKVLTSHVGRKTFGCMLLSKGASMETTTKMLAKTNVKETAKLYAEIQWRRLLSEMPKFGA